MCWSALSIVASYTAQCAAFNREPPTLFLSNPRNVRRFLSFLLMFWTNSFSSSQFSFLAKSRTVFRPVIVPRNHRRRRSQYGPCIAGVCFFGTFAPACEQTRAAQRTRPNSHLMRGRKHKRYRIPSISTFAIWTLR